MNTVSDALSDNHEVLSSIKKGRASNWIKGQFCIFVLKIGHQYRVVHNDLTLLQGNS